MTNEIKVNTHLEDDEIDLIELAKTLWGGRKIIIKTVIAFSIIGLLIAVLTPKQYSVSTTLVPQTQGKNNVGGLASLASMAGFSLNLSNGTTELLPQVYPQIVESVPFQLEIINTPFSFGDIDHPVTLYQYYTEYHKPGFLSTIKKYTIGLPGVILKSLRGKPDNTSLDEKAPALRLTPTQERVRKILANNISLVVNDKQGVVELSSNFFDAELAAQVALKAKDLLQQYITEFKIEKAEAQLKFVEERFSEKKKEFENAQAKLASYRDRNRNMTSAIARTEEEQLQNEYELAFSVYSELAKQLEQAQIKVKEDTPVFSTIKPVSIPLEKSKPNRPLILLVWIFLGAVAGIGWVFGVQYFYDLRGKILETPAHLNGSKKKGTNGYHILEHSKEKVTEE
jgi:uncharacterized protein involved in exopolysaccharide biosynthesis